MPTTQPTVNALKPSTPLTCKGKAGNGMPMQIKLVKTMMMSGSKLLPAGSMDFSVLVVMLLSAPCGSVQTQAGQRAAGDRHCQGNGKKSGSVYCCGQGKQAHLR